MTLLVFGKTGQVATELQAQADVLALGRAEVDLTDPAACAAAIATHRPRVVINAAAYTAVDRAEEDEATAALVNGAAPGAMARACAELGIPLVHISTDYVFDGAGEAAFTRIIRPDRLGPMGGPNLRAKRRSARAGQPTPSCARAGFSPRMGRISSRRCCGFRKRGTS